MLALQRGDTMTMASEERAELLALMLQPIPGYSFDPANRRVGTVVAESRKSRLKNCDSKQS